MKVFVFSTHAAWQPHLETELEVIQGHLDKGDVLFTDLRAMAIYQYVM